MRSCDIGSVGEINIERQAVGMIEFHNLRSVVAQVDGRHHIGYASLLEFDSPRGARASEHPMQLNLSTLGLP